MFLIKLTSLIFFLLPFHVLIFGQTNYYVSPSGNDSNDGSLANPWLTIQYAADNVSAGDTVFVRDGVYNEAVTINVSGSASQGYIVFTNYFNEHPVIDGSGLTVPSTNNGLFFIENKGYIIIQGFELRNYKTSVKDIVPAGIYITGTSNNIKILNCTIHNIEHNGQFTNGADAHGIAVYGTNAVSSINNIIIDNNELYDLILGSSETLVLNGNVEQFTVSNNNVHDVNNIGIDCIGFEGTASANDQARNGKIIDNIVYNVTSINNPAYNFSYGADGIYVDGGKDIVIERNIVHNADVGIELASEHNKKFTKSITVRNNLVYYSNIAGISLGGYNPTKGSADSCKIINNTFYHNDTQQEGNGEIWLQYHIRNTVIKNNIINANNQAILISNIDTSNTNSNVDYNLYYSPNGANNSTWIWKTIEYYEFSTYQTNTGNDANGIFNDPLFLDATNQDFHLSDNSPAIDIGDNSVDAGTVDLDGNQRIQNFKIDLGTYEKPSLISVSVKIFLQGPYNIHNHLMNTDINSIVPITSPYPEDPRTVQNIPANVVDWVLLQLRKNPNGNVVVSKSVFIDKNGNLVDDDGSSPTISLNADPGNYYIIVKQRNHLSVMSAGVVTLTN